MLPPQGPARSVLFAPANHPRRLEKLWSAGADVVVLDLEDAVAVSEKALARKAAAEALGTARHPRAFVRVNALGTPWCLQDVEAVIGPGLRGLMIPKAESAQQFATLDWVLAQLEMQRGLPQAAIELLPLIETAAGVLAAAQIAAASQRIRRLSFGSADYTNSVGLAWTAAEDELGFARMQLVHASAAAGLDPPIDSIVLDIRDTARFLADAQRARRLGFGGKLCIHPDQVPLANRAFAPDEAEVQQARRILDAFTAAEARGEASITVDGTFVDYPVAERARRLLDLAGRG